MSESCFQHAEHYRRLMPAKKEERMEKDLSAGKEDGTEEGISQEGGRASPVSPSGGSEHSQAGESEPAALSQSDSPQSAQEFPMFLSVRRPSSPRSSQGAPAVLSEISRRRRRPVSVPPQREE